MRNSVVLFLLLGVATAGPLAAQSVATRPHADVPAALDVAGLHLVLTEEAQRLVQQKADGLCRHQPSFQARVDLADASFPIIDRVLKEEGVPLDFRYLALQESALIGNARSIHDAVGYWQLKQETATGLGLAVNNDVDERQHLTASTRAAARYLSRSNASLHNWMNALLSYYTGLGGVKPYTLPTDVDATEVTITEATSPYVLMFLAQKIAFEPACGLNPRPPLLLREFPAVAGQTLADQATALHTDPAALATHNRWLLAAAVPADRPYTLIVPVGDVTQAAGIVANQRLQSSKELLTMPAVGRNTAEVRINKLRALIALPGETTADLARRGHQRLGEFLHHNEMKAFDVAKTGRPYFLENKRDAAAVEYHVLQPGESIFDVAQKYGMRQKAVLAKNRMHRVDELRPGRVLWLQHTRPREVAVEYRSLSEAVALERPAKAAPISMGNDELVERLNEAVTARQTEQPGPVKVKIKVKSGASTSKSKRVVTEDDGWGEVLTSATAAASTPAPAPEETMPAPVRPTAPAPRAAQLPPPAAAPAPEPLADEPAPAPEEDTVATPAPAEAPVASRPAVVYTPAPRPVPTPVPTPVVSAPIIKPLPAPVAKPIPAPVPTPASSPAPVARPVVAPVKPVAVSKPAVPTVVTAAAPATTHRVEPGETLYAVSRLYNIPPATLMAINQLTPPANLAVGQVLLLQAQGPLPATTKAAPAQTVSVQAPPVPAAPRVAPRPANPGGYVNPAALYVPKKAASTTTATPAPAAATFIQHTVAKGETLYSISKQYNVSLADLQAWNGKAEPSVKLGEVLRVQTGAK